MDTQLAYTVMQRWNDGLPVSEKNLYKAAAFLGEDPELALVEARYYTTLDGYLNRGGRMNDYEKIALSLACAQHPNVFTKVASSYGITTEQAIISTLSDGDFIPYLYKLAEMEPGVPQDGAALQQDPNARQGLDPAAIQQMTGNPAALTSQDWQGQAMYKPTPTAPGQLPPGGPGGNMDQLMQNEANKPQIEAQKNEQMRQQMMAQTQQQPQEGSKEQIQQVYNQMTPDEKAQHAVPEANPQELPEIAQHIQAVEGQVGTAITDPAQIKKIYGEMQKAKKKEIDEAIKMQFQNQADMSGAGAFGPLPDRLGGGGGQPDGGGAPGGAPGGDPSGGAGGGAGGPPPGGPQGDPGQGAAGGPPGGGGAGGPPPEASPDSSGPSAGPPPGGGGGGKTTTLVKPKKSEGGSGGAEKTASFIASLRRL